MRRTLVADVARVCPFMTRHNWRSSAVPLSQAADWHDSFLRDTCPSVIIGVCGER